MNFKQKDNFNKKLYGLILLAIFVIGTVIIFQFPVSLNQPPSPPFEHYSLFEQKVYGFTGLCVFFVPFCLVIAIPITYFVQGLIDKAKASKK